MVPWGYPAPLHVIWWNIQQRKSDVMLHSGQLIKVSPIWTWDDLIAQVLFLSDSWDSLAADCTIMSLITNRVGLLLKRWIGSIVNVKSLKGRVCFVFWKIKNKKTLMGGCYGLGVSIFLVFMRTVQNGGNNKVRSGIRGICVSCMREERWVGAGGMRTLQRHGGVRPPKNKPLNWQMMVGGILDLTRMIRWW